MSVSYALADSSGGYVQELAAPEGMRLGVLFSYAAGEKLIDAPDEVHHMIGRQMALMHGYTEGFGLKRVSYTPEVLLCESFRYLEPFLPADTAEMSFMRSARDYLFAELNQADDTQLPCGAVHLDMWFDNLVVAGETITVFDFDFCGNGWLCTDVAYYLMQLHALTPDEAACARKTERFLEGYESVAPLSAEERRLLPHLGVSLYFFYLGEQCRRFENWSNVFINDVYLKRYITVRVKKYFDYHFNSSAVLA
jgi:Ser/Thr protein kinase RdoA (MazF antagonist)